MHAAFSYTYGALDRIVTDGPLVSVSGWVIGLDEDITSLEFRCDGRDVPIETIEFNLPSPDVEQVWPNLPHTSNCRCRLAVRLQDDVVGSSSSKLLSVAPKAGDRDGVLLERMLPLRLPIPSPEQSITVGHGDFVETSFSMLTLFRIVAGLSRDARVLDPGCGIGRIAYALCHYLSPRGRYEGFDVSAEAIGVARTIFSGVGNFSFQHVDLYNKMYNPTGRTRGANFKFPYSSGSFDFAVMTSVFTHLLPDEARNYLAEISRTLVPGGSCFATFFALDELAKANVKSGKASLNIAHQYARDCFVQDPNVPEGAVGYDYQALLNMIADAGLAVDQVHWGMWPGRDRFLSYQDIFLLTRR